MATIKNNVIKMIKKMDKDVSVEDIMAELYFRQKVDEGLKQLDEGKSLAHEDVEKRMHKLLKKQDVQSKRNERLRL